MLSSAVKVFCFEYQHPHSDAKNENLQKQLDEKREIDGKTSVWVTLVELRLPPGEKKTWQDGGGGGVRMRQQREESLGVSQGLGKVML